jgi:hypothetical protein
MSSTELLDQLLARVSASLSPAELAKLQAQAAQEMELLRWVPNPGAQTEATNSLADQLLFGGKAGGGKSDTLIGLATTRHRRSLLLRRLNKEVHFLVDRTEEILGTDKGYNGQDKRWYLPDGRLIMYGGCQHPGDEKGYKGEPKDFIGIDEASEFLETQVDFLTGWLRSKDPRQPVRLVLATNPPTSIDGEWLMRWFAPWVDPQHPLFPWPIGKLLYFERLKDGSFRWETELFEIALPSGKIVRSLSRTYIPAELEDNPDYAKTDYSARLAALPEELRRRYERGEWFGNVVDDEWQVIPTAWIEAAQARWTPEPPAETPMTAMGVDIAQGGADNTVLAPRHNEWFGPLVKAAGTETPDGPSAAALVVKHLRDGAQVNIDLGGGWGGSCYDHLVGNEVASVLGVNPAEESTGRTADGRLRFANKRAEIKWRLREALDPSSNHKLALPPGASLKAELAAARWRLTSSGIRIEEKVEIKKRLGRSPDEGEAVELSWFSGTARVKRFGANRMHGLPSESVNPNRIRHHRRRSGGGTAYVGTTGGGEQG